MKKLLFSVAILAVAASCSKNEVTEVAPAAQSAIGFATLNNLTRDANDDDQQYMVYAAQEDVTGAWYINGDYSTTDGDALQNTYYWPADGSYLDFYAYAPYTAGTPSVTAAETISIEYTVPESADEDFTIAAPLKDKTENTVAFTFAHKLAKADIAVVLSTELISAGYTLTMDTKVEGAAATGTEGEDGYVAAVEAVDAATVTLGVANETATFDVMTGLVTNYATGSGASYTTDYDGNYFIFMPQAAPACTISVSGVTITDPSDKVIAQSVTLGTYTITEGDLENFDESTYYAITLTIDNATIDDEEEEIFGDAIKFSATTATWITYTDGLGLGSTNQASIEDTEDEL